MFAWFRRRPPPPTNEQVRLAEALATYPAYAPPEWDPAPQNLGQASNAYREYFFANKESRLYALRGFFAKFDVSMNLEDAGLMAVSGWLPQYADLLLDDFNSEDVRDAYRTFSRPWIGPLNGLNIIFDLGIYYAECVWLRRTKLKWIVMRGPDIGIVAHAISGLPGGKLTDPMHWTYNHCRNVWVTKKAMKQRLPHHSRGAGFLSREAFSCSVLSEAPPGRRRRKSPPSPDLQARES